MKGKIFGLCLHLMKYIFMNDYLTFIFLNVIISVTPSYIAITF